MERLISLSRSVIIAADVESSEDCGNLAFAVKDVEGVGAFKLGFAAAREGLSEWVNAIRANMFERIPIIYDHQKAGTDIPETGTLFAKQVKASGCNAVILFPWAGRETHTRGTNSCQDVGLHVGRDGDVENFDRLVREDFLDVVMHCRKLMLFSNSLGVFQLA